jgi:hypothetical protein
MLDNFLHVHTTLAHVIKSHSWRCVLCCCEPSPQHPESTHGNACSCVRALSGTRSRLRRTVSACRRYRQAHSCPRAPTPRSCQKSTTELICSILIRPCLYSKMLFGLTRFVFLLLLSFLPSWCYLIHKGCICHSAFLAFVSFLRCTQMQSPFWCACTNMVLCGV